MPSVEMNTGQEEPVSATDNRSLQSRPDQSQPSLASNVMASASGLLKGLGGADDASETLSNLQMGASSKLHNGSASSAYSTESGRSITGREVKLGLQEHQTVPHSSLRTDNKSQTGNEEFDRFQSSGHAYKHDLGPSTNSIWATQFNKNDTLQNLLADSYTSQRMSKASPAESVVYDDGAEVRSLLDQPALIRDCHDQNMYPEELAMEDEVSAFNEKLSMAERGIAKQMRNHLPPPPFHHPVAPSNSLNLHPAIEILSGIHLDFRDIGDELQQETNSYIENRSRMNPEQRAHLFEQWEDVLSQYTDEVWGPILPTVKELQSQLLDLRLSKNSPNDKVTARLKMILEHMSSSGFSHYEASHNTIPTDEKLSADNKTEHFPYQNGKRLRDPTLASFHCPWGGCHEACESLTQLRLHQEKHALLACPHTGCGRMFTEQREWAVHFQGTHLGL